MEIILIRHGKPESANNPVINAAEFTRWVKRYNTTNVALNSRPTSINNKISKYFVISSDLKRAIHSAKIYTNDAPKETYKLFREMEIPRYKLPFKLKAWTWVYLNRILWMLGKKGSFESYNHAKQRAEVASTTLINLVKEQKTVVLFGHGFMNYHIRKSLISKGWQLKCKNSDFWGITRLTLTHIKH